MAVDLVPEGGGGGHSSAVPQLAYVIGTTRPLNAWPRKSLCCVSFHGNNFYLLRMMPNLTLRFGFKCLAHWSTEKPKSCSGSVKRRTTNSL